MLTLSGVTERFRRISQHLTFLGGQSHHVRVWADCRHCDTKTRQVARPINGYYRCLQCDQNPNALPEAEA